MADSVTRMRARQSLPVFLCLVLLFGPGMLRAQSAPPPSPAAVIGTVTDASGAVVAGATITLEDQGSRQQRHTSSGSTGFFSFADVAPANLKVTIAAPGYAPFVSPAIALHPGERYEVPHIVLQVASARTNVEAVFSPHELAEEQVKAEEKQRVLGFFPNFLVTYEPAPAPLSARQKFRLAGRMSIDPVTFFTSAASAGIEQWQNDYPGFGQGAQGYGKRFGAAYADNFTSTMIGGAVLPSLLHQDPRYYYKGRGSIGARALYALSGAFACKGDNGHWQPNYSNILGNFASAGLSNLYYPASDRHGARLTVENALVGTAAGAVANLFQEFLLRKMTPSASARSQKSP